MLPQTPEEALLEINKGIERQKSGLAPGQNDTMIFIGYLVIGTDNDAYNLLLRRDYEPNKYGIFTPPSSGAADLVLKSNYQVDGGRLNSAEANNGDLQREQTALEEELNRIIPEINKLRKNSLDIKEENALIRERLKILQEQLEDRKRSVFKLKEENENLKRENQELTNYIKNQENLIKERQALQTTIKVKQRPNISHGKSAITSKFEQSALRTFLPRAIAKPITEDYIQNNTYSAPKATIISPLLRTKPAEQYIIPTSNEKLLQTKYLPTIYHQEKIISNEPLMVQEEHPDVAYSTKPNIGDDMNFSAKQYTTSNTIYTYKNFPPSNVEKPTIYSGKIDQNIGNKSYTSNYISSMDIEYNNNNFGSDNNGIHDMPYTISGAKNVAYSSSGTRAQNMPYSSSGRRNQDLSYTSSGRKNQDPSYTSSGRRNQDVPYTSTGKRNQDPSYTSSGRRNQDVPYTSSGKRNQDLSYTRQTQKGVNNNNKDIGYTSSQINQKDVAYGSQISNNSNLGGYSSQMAKNLGDSTNEGYSSQMAIATEKYIQGDTNKKPKGSRAPNANQTNYSKMKGSRAPNANKKSGNNEPDIGYSSYK